MAELESVYLVRELRDKMTFPLKEKELEEAFCKFFISLSELDLIQQAAAVTEPAREQIKLLLQKQSTLYEQINLERSLQLLKEIPAALQNNLAYLQQIQNWQSTSSIEIAKLFNQIPKLRTAEEKIQANEEIKKLFRFLLRNPNFNFYAQDIVHEGPAAQIKGLMESLEKGFFFHVSLDEEYKKVSFEMIKKRIPWAELQEVAEVEKNVRQIKKGIDAAYEANMRMVNFAVILYSYVKWLTSR
ncbi:MAG: hypothetical protein ABIG52_01255 [Nanoarchaeota archaeon]|nr:hypothetical protein [Nanoarchaeota archaeon]